MFSAEIGLVQREILKLDQRDKCKQTLLDNLSFVTVRSDYINFNKISAMYDLTVAMILKEIH